MNDDYLGYISTLGESLRGLSKWAEIYQQQINAIELVSALKPLVDFDAQYRELVNSVVPKQVEILKEVKMSWDRELLTNALSLQMEAISSALQCAQTEAISSLLKSFSQASWNAGMEEFIQNIEVQSFTQVANIAFLCKAKGLDSFLKEGYPSGMKTLIKNIHKRTADRIALNENIEVSYREKIFRSVNNTNCGLNVVGMNIIASSTELFEELKEEDLIAFIDVLANEYAFASEHPIGKTIWRIIQEWNNFIDFDKEYYYHGRVKKANGFTYTSDEMGKAPSEVIGYGRFNHMKQSHYYFADTEKGARAEINIHNRGAEVQVARLKPKRSIRMIDLSGEITNNNKFLECIRYTASDSVKPNEYLLPEYLTTCCKKAEIEGIKYYGSKEYNNYVCWNDGYFDVDIVWNA